MGVSPLDAQSLSCVWESSAGRRSGNQLNVIFYNYHNLRDQARPSEDDTPQPAATWIDVDRCINPPTRMAAASTGAALPSPNNPNPSKQLHLPVDDAERANNQQRCGNNREEAFLCIVSCRGYMA